MDDEPAKINAVSNGGYLWMTSLQQINTVSNGGYVWMTSLQQINAVSNGGYLWMTSVVNNRAGLSREIVR